MAYLTLFISSVIINNFVLTRFLGLCIFFGVSKNLNASIGMGMAVTSVLTFSSMLAWVVYHFVLLPFHLTFLTTVVFVLLIASFVQLLEMIIKKQAPALYNMWGIYLLLIATNCIVLSVPLLNVESSYTFLMSVVNAIGAGFGFAIAIILMASLREKLRLADVPKPLQGLGIAFILAGMLALAFLGFSGMIAI
ncbi:RnfABCDGE type electron transport complex subunit A [Clostridium tyrobutyricum]|jgi:electron transport complex protein RnfA|uniref:Ion-translocating oxidoreductase complex subunit A n=3 Tax=Clostridium tyrobutyricum TaxID=1519 RepID=W6N7D0_CLOTY|nr:RnfABCDGE type electron transport complex subunit A [Clostridium tyrobutyricum]AND84568.1 electron transport complex protein RnfA [Clostridium tyrobutyricum]ANP69178.1 electron transport complex subunit RsxA [Clostridium tyrobutyricum]MBV4415555.1 RnfABCDGE type electron transport complex subunit A [Clostridium tyrobutyricum]MBV4421364.1 RnfABCDGE type electron transport complex subunit A [Clostridium tyrobutyricum]MBV4425028.1 RnfABCDGE type electron transport complex subunit A [Clostridiu